MNNNNKRYTLMYIKYTPSIMAITCAIKILLSHYYAFIYLHLINVILNIYIVIGFYITGKYLGYCWKHRSLCRTSIYGYIAYTIFLLTDSLDYLYVRVLCIIYIIIIILMLIIYGKGKGKGKCY